MSRGRGRGGGRGWDGVGRVCLCTVGVAKELKLIIDNGDFKIERRSLGVKIGDLIGDCTSGG